MGFLIGILICIFCAALGAGMGKERSPGMGGGALLGGLLGIFGIIILLCLPKVKSENSYSESSITEPFPKGAFGGSVSSLATTQPRQPHAIERLSKSLNECPYCFEPVSKQARFCESCKHDISFAPDDTPVFPAPEDLIIEKQSPS